MSQQAIRHDKHCRICGSEKVETVFKLTDTPLGDEFVRIENITQPVYPLELAMCLDCGYVYLPYIVNHEASYVDYVYVSGITVGLRSHYDEYAQEIVANFGLQPDSLIVDLGSNDGSMLASFKRSGMKVLGVEPATNIALQANQSGLPTINDFFTDKVASQILDEYGKARVVTANYMYANIDDVLSFTRSVARLLTDDGLFVIETGYHPEQMKIRMFDYIYHEHFSYFTVDVLDKLFSACGLKLVDVKKTKPKGGSIRVVAQLKEGSRPVNDRVRQLIEEERISGMRDPETYRKFANEITDSKNQLRDLLDKLKAEGKKIVGFGASHSTTTLIYHFGLAPYLDYLVDDNVLKHGTFSPGYHLPVYSAEKLNVALPDYVLILGWQHQNSIMGKHTLINGAKWIVPLPDLKII